MEDTARTMRQYPLRMDTYLFHIAERLKQEEGRSLNEQLVELVREALRVRGELPQISRKKGR